MDLWLEVSKRFPVQELGVRPELRADRPRSPARRVVELLALPESSPRVLLTGTIGTGKTTELQRIAEARGNDDFVLFLDLYHHFHTVVGEEAALQTVAPWEVCFLVGVALVRAMRERLGEEPPPEVITGLQDTWKKLARKADVEQTADVDIGKLGKAMLVLASSMAHPAAGAAASIGLTALEGATDALKSTWRIPTGKSRSKVTDQAEENRTLLSLINQLLGEIQHRHRRVLLVLDGLDRVEKIDRAEELFVTSQLLPSLGCAMVITGPFALRHHPSLAMVPGFDHRVVLVNEPVIDKADPTQHGPGIAFFREMFARRVRDLAAPETLLAPTLLDRLAYYSGGRSRDFVRLVQMLSLEMRVRRSEVVTAEPIDAVLREARLLMEHGLHVGHIELLESVARDPKRRLPSNPLVWDLLRLDRLLPYPNENEWYFPHPLLTLSMVTEWRSGSTAS